MKFSFLSLQRTLLAIVVFLLASCLLWWAVWSLAAAEYRRTIDGWIEAGRVSGYTITYDDRQLFGFPRHVVLRFTNLHWKNTDDIIFHADDIDIGAAPWSSENFDAKFKGHAEIDAPLDADNHALVLGGDNGVARVEIGRDGFWTFSRIDIKNAKIGRAPDYLFRAETVTASATKPHDAPKTHHDAGLTLTGDATNITLPDAMPPSFGNKMARLNIALRIMDTVPDFRRRESVDAWNKDSVVVEFDNLHMEWGSLLLAAKGTMGFDDDLQPEGAFSSIIGNHEQVLKALTDAGFIAERQEGMLDSAMSLFAKPAKMDGISGIEVPIAVQLGGLFLGPVKIFAFPEIAWPVTALKPTP